ncbi:hypothetical protein INT48_004225 [Thamnidium elegans]|uniref:Uncharacterized protein n=1 Tax=Thamnidium elegans TaxID=101142 RepID=A0A8H7SKH1_9FUNG|nr:hypothetical protein INT48_004225 [Thamnidium elegans]
MADTNVQSITDFWLFVVYCLVVIVAVIFFLFYFNRAVGQGLTFFVNQYTWRRYNAYIEVDSIRVSLLGGRILFKNLRYLSTNQSVSIVKGHISFRYWLFNVRKAEDDKIGKTKDLPCRIVCSVEGLEWFFYNNVPAYEKMKDVLGLSTTVTTSSEQEKPSDINGTPDPEKQTPINVDNSLMERLMPIQIECTTGAVMIGNTELKSMLIFEAAKMDGIYSITESRSAMDFYKAVFDTILIKPQISIKDNMDFTKVDENPERVIQSLSRERSGSESESGNTTYHEEYARVNNIIECKEVILTYYQDYAGPVPTPEASDTFPGIGIDIGNGGLPPEWGIRLSLKDATIHYGPWADRQRSAIQDYFFPNSHRQNIPTTRLKPGQSRVATSFETYIEFLNEGKLRVPTREKTKDWKYTSGGSDIDVASDGYYSRPYGWLNVKVGDGSVVKVATPFAIGPNGHEMMVDIALKEVDITTSVNYASFIQSNRIEIRIKMPAPLEWNGFRCWDIKIVPKKPTIFLLRDHVFLLQDLVQDWGSTPPADLLHFCPIVYQIQCILENPIIFLCVNEHNVINNPNSIEDNAFLKVQTQRLTVDLTLPFTEYQSETTAIKFFVTAEHCSAGLSLQNSHTLNSFMREDDANAAVVVKLTVDGSYDFYSTVDVLRHIESCNLHVKIDGATVKLFGTLIRYLFLLKDNYFGAWNNFSTIDEYRRRRSNHQEWLEQKKKQSDAKSVADPFEAYVLLELEDGVMLLPENLYECSRYSQFEFRELQVELRNLDVYLDLYVNISPITLSRDSNPNPQTKEGFFRIKNARDPKNYLYIDGFNVYAHRLFGPLPDCATYVCQWEFDLGRISGEIKPSFLLGLACFSQSFAYNLIDEDNAVPQEMESKDLPDVTFMKLYVQEVDLCLMSMNSATNICLKEGILLEFDNLINAKYSQRISLKIPSILTRCLANPDQARGDNSFEESEYSWVEVAKVDLGLNVTVFRHTAVWKKARNEQQNFIRSQDYLTRRCVRLYEEEEDTVSQHSQSSMPSVDGHHVGVVYAPPFRPFMFGRVEDKSVLRDTSSYTASDSSTSRNRGYSNPVSMTSPHPSSVSDCIYSDSSDEQSNYDIDELTYETRSLHSAISRDNESFYTAKDSENDDDDSITDDYSIISSNYNHFTGEGSFSDEDQRGRDEKNIAEKNLTAAIPPSIPYSDYLRRYKVTRSNSESDHHGSFFHSFIPPSRPKFIPEKSYEEKCKPFYDSFKEPDDYFMDETDELDVERRVDAQAKGNEVTATTVIEATRPMTILLTPILVKIVQELAEEIIKDDWDLETMLDALQMEYIGQLTRYLTDQYICTRFAVILPQAYFHFIQNVTIPDDLTSYKNGEAYVKTQYNIEDNVLCSADIFLNDFRMIGSVKFEDYAFDEKKKKVVESNMVLQESRVHIDVSDVGSKVQYISKQHERQSMAFGIPRGCLRNKDMYSNQDDYETLVDELVMLDLAVSSFSFKWLGARTPNYAELNTKSIDTIIITESVEILLGAVYSWLVFVDDLKGILESFQDQRTRQVQVFINELADFSITTGVLGDPLFLTTPTTMLRLGSRNFRNDVGWKLLARMRHCLRSLPLSRREELQYRLTSGGALQDINSDKMFKNVVKTFSRWRNWEVGYNDISNSRLFTQPFKQLSEKNGVVSKNITDEVVKFLTSSANFAKLRFGNFHFVIYEEETAELSKEDNGISIGPFEFLLECLFKTSSISNVSESSDGIRRTVATMDGYLDIITKISLGDIKISANPIILAFARHMLLVQRVFTTKLHNLSHSKKSPTPLNDSSTTINARSSSIAKSTPSESLEFSFDSLLSKVDVVAQALVSLDSIKVVAHAQELRMCAVISGAQGSALFSNPKLASLQLVSHDRADSDTGSGKRSSNRTSRKNAQTEPRLVLEAAGGINSIDIKFKEELHRNNLITDSTLLGISLEKANVNANISQITKSSKKHGKTENTKDVLNVFSNIHKFRIHAPQSLLRLYGFIESWQTEQGRRYHFMFQNLVREWEEQRKDVSTPPSISEQRNSTQIPPPTTKKLDIKLQFLLNEFLVISDLLPSLSVEYRILDFFVMVNETHPKASPVYMYTFQLSEQVVHLITKDTKKKKAPEHNNTSTFSIPGIRSTGSLRNEVIRGTSQLKLKSMISVDLISMSLNVSLIDSLLTAQSLVGNEVSELVEVLSYSKPSRNSTVAPPESNDSPKRIFKYTVDISLDGLRVSAASPSALCIFRSNVLQASISNDNIVGMEASTSNQLTWKLQAKNFSLSLDHNTIEDIDSTISEDDAVYQPNCLAYILVELSVQNYLPTCTNEKCTKETHTHDKDKDFDTLFINFARIQTVMQPIALGKLAEMYIYYDAELRKKKMMKKAEIDQLSANTKRIVQSISIKNEWPKVLQEETQSLLEGKIICLRVRRLGVAIPLGIVSELPSSGASKSVSALLLSVSSIEFLTKNIEKGALQLDNIALQFVKRFDQDKSEHFIAENHPRTNQISLPSISCHVSAVNAKPLQSVKADAQVRGFEIDVDGTIADYINTLSIIYVKSMSRVEKFTTKSNFSSKSGSPSSSAKPSPMTEMPNTSEVVHLDIECKFICDSGTIRMYPKRNSGDVFKSRKRSKSLHIRTGFDPKSNDGNMATVNLPGLSAWLTYQTPLGAHASVANAPRRFHADILIRESQNTLHPALVQFLREAVEGLKVGIQQSSERKAVRESSAEIESNLNASLFLRLSRTQLDLSCHPSSKVLCSLGWEESEFLMNAFSQDTTSRTMSCVGSVREITAMVKHHFSPEACLNVRLDRILFNAMLTSQRKEGCPNDDISIIIELPNIYGDINMRHLQDLLILNSCWFGQPIISDHVSKPDVSKPHRLVNEASNNSLNVILGEFDTECATDPDQITDHINAKQVNAITSSHPPAPFSKHIAVCVQTIRFSVDMGQNIGKITLSPESISFQLHHVPNVSKGLSLTLDEIKILSEGRLSGSADFKRMVIQGRIDKSNDIDKEMASVCIRSDGFKAVFEYEYQNILDAIQQSLELNINLIRVAEKYNLDLSINLEALVARLSIKTVPVIITMAQKFEELLQKKKAEAGIRSDYDLPTKLNPKANIVVPPSVSSKKDKDLYEKSTVNSKVSLRIKAIEVIIYPSQFQDSDNVNIRAQQFKIDLDEMPRDEMGVHRKLVITLASAALAKNVPGKELMLLYNAPLPPASSKPKNLDGTKIFGIPGTEITMESTQLENKIAHEFSSVFAGRVSVSLNIGLIKYLQEMINMFNIQLSRALEKNSDQLHPFGEPSTPVSMTSTLDDGEDYGGSFSRKSSSVSDASRRLTLDSNSSFTVQTPSIEAIPATVNETDKLTEISAPKEEFVYSSINAVNFQPQLQVMGDATPPVEWLGLKRERIPGLVHENITLHLDQLVKVIWDIFESQTN